MPAGRPTSKKPPAFGARLAKLRQEQGLSQAALAKIIGISQPMIEYYERRAKNPGVAFAVKAAKALGISTDELLGVKPSGKTKSGRKSKLDRYVDEIRKLPRAEQQYVVKFLEQVVKRQG